MTALFLLLVLLSPVIFTAWVVHARKRAIRKEVKQTMIAGLNKSDLARLTFSKAEVEQELEWEHDHEFEYRGKMYDVVERQTKGDSITFWCWEDREETHLNQKLDRTVAGILDDDQPNQRQQQRIQSFLKALFWVKTKIFQFFQALTPPKGHANPSQSLLLGYHPPVFSPPEF
jgi:hypothetical protein